MSTQELIGKMKAALEGAKVCLQDVAIQTSNRIAYPETTKQIEDILAMEPPQPEIDVRTVEGLIRQAYDKGISQHVTNLTVQLYHLPEDIKAKSLELLTIQEQIDQFQNDVYTLKTAAMEKVLTDGLATNDKARITAQTSILAKDQLYIDADKSLREAQKKLRQEQAQLEYLHNTFSAYKAIAGMMAGVK